MTSTHASTNSSPPAAPANPPFRRLSRSASSNRIAARLSRCAAGIEHLAASQSMTHSAAEQLDPLQRELQHHLRDAYDHQIELGLDPETAWQHATTHFGDYETTLYDLQTLHRTPIWEWITRALALVLALVLLNTTHHLQALIQPTLLLLFFIVAPLAAFDPRPFALPAGSRSLARLAALGLFMLALHLDAHPFSDILRVALLAVGLWCISPARTSPSFSTRLHACMLIAMFAAMALASWYIIQFLSTPHRLGAGLVIVIVGGLYGATFARPGWPTLMLIVAAVLFPVSLLPLALPDYPIGQMRPLNLSLAWFIPSPELWTALLLCWARYGRRPYPGFFPAAAVIAMVLILISQMRNPGTLYFSELLLTAAAPIVICLIPAALWLIRTIRNPNEIPPIQNDDRT